MSVIIEVRPGEGGADAEQFAKQLTDAISTYLRRQDRDIQVRPGRTTEIAVTGIERESLPPLAGTHRIQRIPSNDSSGRRHTSTVTVAILDGAAQPTVELDADDLTIQTKRGTGPGGQHRNKTSSAVRIVHKPTGTAVELNRGRSQHSNRIWAQQELIRRLEAAAARHHAQTRNGVRSDQISSGERPARTFTWNQQRAEVLDHTNGTRHPMPELLRGHLELLI
jgi:peptide chain release factor 1